MEQNTVWLTGQVREIRQSWQSPAGVVHRELLFEHRSCQQLAGQPREIKALVTVKVTGASLVASLEGLSPGNRIRVQGFLSQTSHRDTQQLLIHAQVIERIE